MKNSTATSTTKTIWKLRFAQTSLIAGLIGSVSHLAYSIGAYELSGEGWISWIIAVCVELGMLGISLGMADQRRKLSDAKYKPTELDTKSTITLKRAMMLFAAVNVFGNAYYSFAVILSKPRFLLKDVQNNPDKIDEVTWAAIIFFSIIVPALIYVMAELQSIYALNLILERKAADDAQLKADQKADESNDDDDEPTPPPKGKPGPKPGFKLNKPGPKPTVPPEKKKAELQKATKETIKATAPKEEAHLVPGEGQKIRRKKAIVEEIVPMQVEEDEAVERQEAPDLDTTKVAPTAAAPTSDTPERDPITGVELDPLRHNRLRVPIQNS